MRIIGVLTMVTEPDGRQIFGLISPERMYAVLTPELVPDQWLPVVEQLQADGSTTVLGLVADGGKL